MSLLRTAWRLLINIGLFSSFIWLGPLFYHGLFPRGWSRAEEWLINYTIAIAVAAYMWSQRALVDERAAISGERSRAGDWESQERELGFEGRREWVSEARILDPSATSAEIKARLRAKLLAETLAERRRERLETTGFVAAFLVPLYGLTLLGLGQYAREGLAALAALL